MFRLTFLGTSAGLPTKHRNVSGIALECVHDTKQKCGDWLLIDCGEGTQHQLMKTDLQLKKLKAVFITHLHGDHCFGLAGLLSSLAMNGRQEQLTIIAPKGLIKLLDTYSLVNELYFPYPIEFLDCEGYLASDILLNMGKNLTLSIQLTELSHRISSYAFSITAHQVLEKLNIDELTRLGIEKSEYKQVIKNNPNLIKTYKNQQKIVIAGDNNKPELLTNAVIDAHALIHECTYTQSALEKILTKNSFDPMHTTASQIGQFAKLTHIPKLILTHFSARYALFDNPNETMPNMGHIRSEVQKYYNGELILAKDFLRVVV